MNHLDELLEDGYTWYRNASEGAKTLAHQVDCADHDHNTGREGKGECAGTDTGSIGHVGLAEVEGEALDEIASFERFPVPRMEVSEEEEEEVCLRRPSEEVHDRSHFGWNHQSISIDRLKWNFRMGRVWSGS